MSNCNCGSGPSPDVRFLDYNLISGLAATAASAGLAQTRQTTHYLTLDNRPLVATGTEDGKEGCFHFKIFGSVDATLCWEFTHFVVAPGVDVQIHFTAKVAGLKVFAGTLQILCAKVLEPGTCKATFVADEGLAASMNAAAVNWGCLLACAPSCIKCGANYWCWLLCAGPCVIKCFL